MLFPRQLARLADAKRPSGPGEISRPLPRWSCRAV